MTTKAMMTIIASKAITIGAVTFKPWLPGMEEGPVVKQYKVTVNNRNTKQYQRRTQNNQRRTQNNIKGEHVLIIIIQLVRCVQT